MNHIASLGIGFVELCMYAMNYHKLIKTYENTDASWPWKFLSSNEDKGSQKSVTQYKYLLTINMIFKLTP